MEVLLQAGTDQEQKDWCPGCGSEIQPGRDVHVKMSPSYFGRTYTFCSDALGLFLLFSSCAWADTFRVYYSIPGSGRNVTVQADSSGEARRAVMDMFPRALVTGVHQIRK